MGSIPRVLHRVASPISTAEFADAVAATCKPRFPRARSTLARNVCLGISGGVDSMALATLYHKLTRAEPFLKISDSPAATPPVALVIDHKMREDSEKEAESVRRVLVSRFGFKAVTHVLKWPVDPATLPYPEGLARELRYRAMGQAMLALGCVSLMLAHHQDDQYETVLMRLLGGANAMGLRGMRPAQDMPECYDMHGVYQSGYVDDQRAVVPYYNMKPTSKERKYMRENLLQELDVLREQIKPGIRPGDEDVSYLYKADEKTQHRIRSRNHPTWMERLTPCEIEEGGAMVYRPLLEFSKDRLIATCEANKVPWFEDKTNADPTLTQRNAVRQMWQNHALPVALQKPAILALSQRCDNRMKVLEAEATRLIERIPELDFDEHAGTMTLKMPKLRLRIRRAYSRYASTWRRQRRRHLTLVAALFLRRLLAVITPKNEPAPVESALLKAVHKIFPQLQRSAPALKDTRPPKPLLIWSVQMHPYQRRKNGSISWHLSRMIYPNSQPRPIVGRRPFKAMISGERHTKRRLPAWDLMQKLPFELFDGRFWISLHVRANVQVLIMPFNHWEQKRFRYGLSERQRRAYDAVLAATAPKKIRGTLPALYVSDDADWLFDSRLIRKVDHWVLSKKQWEQMTQEETETLRWGRQNESEPAESPGPGELESPEGSQPLEVSKHRKVSEASEIFKSPEISEFPGVTESVVTETPEANETPRDSEPPEISGNSATSEPAASEAPKTSESPDDSASTDSIEPTSVPEMPEPRKKSMRLVALPTLDFCLPGVEKWLKWEVRYRRIEPAIRARIDLGSLWTTRPVKRRKKKARRSEKLTVPSEMISRSVFTHWISHRGY